MTLERVVGWLALVTLLASFEVSGLSDSLHYKSDWFESAHAEFVSHAAEKYLAMNLTTSPATRLREDLEARVGGKSLKNRSEAHVTVITPPEFTVLSSKLSIADLDRVATRMEIQKTRLTAVCVGRGEAKLNGHLEQTYFVVVKAPHLLEIRKAIAMEFSARGGKGEFHPDDFFPHVTLGFTARDLHATDGVKKDEGSCAYGLLSAP